MHASVVRSSRGTRPSAAYCRLAFETFGNQSIGDRLVGPGAASREWWLAQNAFPFPSLMDKGERKVEHADECARRVGRKRHLSGRTPGRRAGETKKQQLLGWWTRIGIYTYYITRGARSKTIRVPGARTHRETMKSRHRPVGLSPLVEQAAAVSFPSCLLARRNTPPHPPQLVHARTSCPSPQADTLSSSSALP